MKKKFKLEKLKGNIKFFIKTWRCHQEKGKERKGINVKE